MQRNNVMSLDAMQKIINSFRQVERKIDRLQDDFLAQSKTLNDLRIMVGNLSGFQNNEEEDIRNKIEKHDMSHASLKRKPQGHHAPKVTKAKSYEPVIAKSTFGSKRPLKKKPEGLKKSGRGRSAIKALIDKESPIRDRGFTANLSKHF
ncbi:uncharacterized protein LOC133527964 [Cydia pomonella]|uniref:uncharacterized protein LOC133527964 n=1 Tax=Cydia pomonella TaxID=82600 RepID=UPI002ADD8A76|nr:uncharacterized protein LOC133527964 [Cydia pomonella]